MLRARARSSASTLRRHVAGGSPNSRLKARLNAASLLKPTD
jgi:hypothetical protein